MGLSVRFLVVASRLLACKCPCTMILFCQWTRVTNTGMLGFVSICNGFGTECFSAMVLFLQMGKDNELVPAGI